MYTLAIESSADETAAAVIRDGVQVVSTVVASSTSMHRKFGGIVPEVAARAHLTAIIPTIEQALDDARLQIHNIDRIAVTHGPGLIGSLLVGVEAAKTIAVVTGKPIVPVNHVLAHIYTNFAGRQRVDFPVVALVVSGGHTELYRMDSHARLTWLGGTIDDAAGEAFDKSARVLGFANGGGPAIQEAAKQFTNHNSQFPVKLPRPMIHDETYNFSFSGLKTAIMREWKKHTNDQTPTTDNKQLTAMFAHEIQEAITDVLVAKAVRAAVQAEAKMILLAGGVAANIRLRDKLRASLPQGAELMYPPVPLCTDNAVAIGIYAHYRGAPADVYSLTAVPDLSVEVQE